MNERANEALVKAWLEGHPQGRQYLHSSEGDCAIGVIHLAAHEGSRVAAIRCAGQGLSSTSDGYRCARQWGEMTDEEIEDIWRANDLKKWDFLTIARKLGNTDGQP